MDLSVAMPQTEIVDASFVQTLEGQAASHMALATRMLGNPEDARDALQDAWLRAWRGRGGLRSADAVHGWLRSIVVRECLRVLRWRSVRRAVTFGLADHDPADSAPGPERINAAAQEAARVRRAVATLSPRQRLVWGLRFDEGWTVAEIAAATELRPDTVRTHLGRALIAVHARLESSDGL
jgi:RNA polymerase sigma-70 factor (ECF subfamily)